VVVGTELKPKLQIIQKVKYAGNQIYQGNQFLKGEKAWGF
jgi:hypothetical protein